MLFLFERDRRTVRCLLLVFLSTLASAGHVTETRASGAKTSYIIFHVPIVESLDDARGDHDGPLTLVGIITIME